MPQVRAERSGWRDETISKRHRLWGWDCPAIDIDFLMIEYNRGNPIALVEYKHERAMEFNIKHTSYQAMIKLANASKIPCFVARYADDFSWWDITPINGYATKFLPKKQRITERQWVAMLYKIRGYPLPTRLEKELHG